MKKLGLAGITAACLAAAAATPVAAADGYPSDTVHVVVPYRAGGGTDVIARALSTAMEKVSGKAVVVDNLTAGAGNAALAHVRDAKPDGHTLLLNGSSDMNAPIIFRGAPYKLDDYTCVGAVYETPTWVLAHKDSGITDLAQFIDMARAEPDKYTIGVGHLTSTHGIMASAIIGSNKIKARIIPFDGGGPLMKAILGNQLTIGVIHAPVLLDAVKKGDVKVIAAGGSLENIAYEPVRGTKTLDNYNTPIDFGVVRGLFAPKATPPEVLKNAEALVEKAAKSDEFKKFGAQFGFAPIWWDGKKFCDFMKKEDKDYRQIKADYFDKK